MSIVIVGAGPNLGMAVARRFGREDAPGGDHEPSEIADLLWSHHVDRATFQTRVGIPA